LMHKFNTTCLIKAPAFMDAGMVAKMQIPPPDKDMLHAPWEDGWAFLLKIAALGHDVPDQAVLAIGDGVQTDVAGAMGEDIDALFITGGLAARETKTSHQPDPKALNDYLKREKTDSRYSIGQLR